MNPNRVISTAVLFLLLGITLPAFAQRGEEEKGSGGEKAQPAQHQTQQKQQPQRAEKAQSQRAEKAQSQRAEKAQSQRAEKAQPQRAEKAQPQRAEKAQPQHARQSGGQQQQSVAYNGGDRGNGNNGGHYGRISDEHYRAHFGHEHSFHMIRPRMVDGYNRFQYGGYWFGYNDGWPVGWDYNDDCYVEYIDGVYYMFNLRHPGIRLTLNIF